MCVKADAGANGRGEDGEKLKKAPGLQPTNGRVEARLDMLPEALRTPKVSEGMQLDVPIDPRSNGSVTNVKDSLARGYRN